MNYIQQAFKGNNEWLYWILTILLVFFGWQIIGGLPLMALAFMNSANLAEFTKAGQDNFMTLGIDNNLFLFFMILMFIFGLISLIIGVKFIHKRSFTSLVTSRMSIDWKRFFFGFITWGIIASVVIIVGIYISPENYVWNFKPIPFFTLLAVSFLFLPFQTSFEELLFRGYFMQGIGVATLNKRFSVIFNYIILSILLIVFSSKIESLSVLKIVLIFVVFTTIYFSLSEAISKTLNHNFNINLVSFYNTKLTPLLITSICFGLLHGANPEVQKLGYISMVFYIGTGLFYGITTLMDEGTELSLGLHAINNIVAAFFVTTNWTVFQTDALYVDTSEPSVGWGMFFPVLVLYPLMLFIFSKKYGWKNWAEKLTGSIEKPVELTEDYNILDKIGEE